MLGARHLPHVIFPSTDTHRSCPVESALSNLLVGVISSIVGATIFELLRVRFPIIPAPVRSSAPPHTRPSEPDYARERNRRFLRNVLFYALTFFVLYVFISFPPVIRALIGSTPIYLDDARLIGGWLPHTQVTGDHLQFSFALLTLLLYFPVLCISKLIAVVLARIGNLVTSVTEDAFERLHLVAFTALSLLVAAASDYAFSSRPWKESLIAVVVVTLAASMWALSSSSGEKRGA